MTPDKRTLSEPVSSAPNPESAWRSKQESDREVETTDTGSVTNKGQMGESGLRFAAKQVLLPGTAGQTQAGPRPQPRARAPRLSSSEAGGWQEDDSGRKMKVPPIREAAQRGY